MDRLGRGLIAGFLATLVLSMAVDPLTTLARHAGVLMPAVGWVLHFTIGTLVWGGTFALVHAHLPGPSWLRGLIFGLAAWLFVMVAVLPMTHAGLFGWAFGWKAPASMLFVHLVYGALLALIYDFLGTEDPKKRNRDDPSGHSCHWHPVAR